MGETWLCGAERKAQRAGVRALSVDAVSASGPSLTSARSGSRLRAGAKLLEVAPVEGAADPAIPG